MKKIMIILVLVFFYGNGFAQKAEEIHVSFNLFDGDYAMEVVKGDGGHIDFYLKDELFEHNPQTHAFQILEPKDLDSIVILDIHAFVQEELKIRKEKIATDESKGILTVLQKNEIFDDIQLYFKDSLGKIYRYEVDWVEATLD
ncbi:hypothetical protein [Ulvibacterium sp.]|uniref:hypothetical protein n=1 Tax=Ulvibacterium sp. TaxID=2665914 RepID=UPI003BAB21AA